MCGPGVAGRHEAGRGRSRRSLPTSGQTMPERWRRAVEGEPHWPGQQHAADPGPDAQRRPPAWRRAAHRSRSRSATERRPARTRTITTTTATIAKSSVERKNCTEDQQAEEHAGHDGAVALAHEDLVEHGQDQRQHHERRRHEVGALQAGQHEGREAVEQAAEEGGRGPGRPAPDGPRTPCRRVQGGRDGGGHVERGHGPPDPRDRDQRHAQPRHRRLGQQVDPAGMEQRRGEEGVLPVRQRGGRPLEEPQEEGGIPAAAERVGGAARRPRRAPRGRSRGRDRSGRP